MRAGIGLRLALHVYFRAVHDFQPIDKADTTLAISHGVRPILRERYCVKIRRPSLTFHRTSWAHQHKMLVTCNLALMNDRSTLTVVMEEQVDRPSHCQARRHDVHRTATLVFAKSVLIGDRVALIVLA